jgi:DNA-binding response OmpR family regulator
MGRVRILVVDDEPSVRDALDRALRLDGYKVALAPDGRAALEALADEPPDAVVLDVFMPAPDGSPRATRCPTASAASTPAPTTTWSSRSRWRS